MISLLSHPMTEEPIFKGADDGAFTPKNVWWATLIVEDANVGKEYFMNKLSASKA